MILEENTEPTECNKVVSVLQKDISNDPSRTIKRIHRLSSVHTPALPIHLKQNLLFIEGQGATSVKCKQLYRGEGG